MKKIPVIRKYMTVLPLSVGAEQTLAVAEQMMSEHRIRHLPVLRGGDLCGIVTDRDLKFIKGFKDVDPASTLVRDLSNPEVFTVSPDAPLDEVCDRMVEHKYGCVVVVDHGNLVGIFTWVDALAATADLLRTRLAA